MIHQDKTEFMLEIVENTIIQLDNWSLDFDRFLLLGCEQAKDTV